MIGVVSQNGVGAVEVQCHASGQNHVPVALAPVRKFTSPSTLIRRAADPVCRSEKYSHRLKYALYSQASIP